MSTRSSRNLALAWLRDTRASGELTVHLLLTAAGVLMVSITLPALLDASNTAARTFKNQVTVLERGAGSGADTGGGGWQISAGPGGVSASGPLGSGVTGSVTIGKSGVTGSAHAGSGSTAGASGSGGAGSSAAATSPPPIVASSPTPIAGAGAVLGSQQGILDGLTH